MHIYSNGSVELKDATGTRIQGCCTAVPYQLDGIDKILVRYESCGVLCHPGFWDDSNPWHIINMNAQALEVERRQASGIRYWGARYRKLQ
ncbi:MAG: hypothetical protein MUD08_06300 [Cytophagales bacterium]|nr:hypothetical protein [Cytophagales bacterium]